VPGAPPLVSQHEPPVVHFVPVAQHVMVSAPQGGTHVPAVHVPPFDGHVLVGAMHLLPSQQPPPKHAVAPGQHA
jgi:hypothetical protein